MKTKELVASKAGSRAADEATKAYPRSGFQEFRKCRVWDFVGIVGFRFRVL